MFFVGIVFESIVVERFHLFLDPAAQRTGKAVSCMLIAKTCEESLMQILMHPVELMNQALCLWEIRSSFI